jgi:2'-5' RNA ligase
MKSAPFNIVIAPSKQVAKKAAGISKKLKGRGGLFVLDKNHSPHITLYMTEFPLKNIPEIKTRLQGLAAKMRPFLTSSLNYGQSKDGDIDINYWHSRDIQNLQRKIISLLNPLRGGLIRKRDEERKRLLPKKQQRNIELYGYRSVGQEFHPHLTFTKLAKFNKSAFANIKKLNFSFVVKKIGFSRLGDHGTCHKLIKTFDLNK